MLPPVITAFALMRLWSRTMKSGSTEMLPPFMPASARSWLFCIESMCCATSAMLPALPSVAWTVMLLFSMMMEDAEVMLTVPASLMAEVVRTELPPRTKSGSST